MDNQLRVLLVEDSPDDAALLLRELRREGFDTISVRVETASAMRDALAEQVWDVVIADHVMPTFNSFGALSVLKQSQLDLPFVIVSGSIGEDVAVEAMKAGAHDYIIKGNLSRLAPAIRRELQEAVVRRERRRAEDELRRAKDELEIRVEERTGQLKEAYERLALKAQEAQEAAEERRRLLIEVERERQRVVVLAAQAAASLQQLEAVVGSITEGLIVSDLDGNIVLVNPSARNVYGISQEEAVPDLAALHSQLELRDLEHKPLSEDLLPLKRAMRGETFENMEVEARRKDTGQSQTLSYNGTVVRNDSSQPALAVVTLRDITLQKEAERLREEYVSLISHDLRNPLTVLMGQADWMRLTLERKGMEREARNAATMLKSARQMNSMIQDLVESARLEAGHHDLSLEPTDVLQLLLGLVEGLTIPGDRDRIRVEAPDWVPPVVADSARLERAIVNLITNALKYSPVDAPVIVRIEQIDQEAVISVSDRGVGIPADEIEYLFARFYRARTAGKHEGLGLGLYITRLIVEAHGGRVWVRSEVGQGSVFHLALPIQPL